MRHYDAHAGQEHKPYTLYKIGLMQAATPQAQYYV